MNGGPATVYGARAFAAFREFYDQRAGGNSLSGQEQPTGHEHEIGQPNGHQRVGLSSDAGISPLALPARDQRPSGADTPTGILQYVGRSARLR